MEENNRSNGVVKSDETLFQLIEVLAENPTTGVTELADAVGNSKSSIHKHLKTLEQHGYVENNDGQYSLGFRFLTVGGQVRDRNDLCQYARSTVADLADEVNEMVSFIIQDGEYGVFACITNDRYGLRERVPLGSRYPLSQNAAGKAILAKSSDEDIETYIETSALPQQTDNTITDADQLWDEIAAIRDRGYATSVEERVEGVRSIAAAVQSNSSNRIGALAIAGPADYVSRNRIHDEYSHALIEAANDLELRVRYSTQ